MEFSGRLKQARKEKGLTQKELADVSGIAVSSIINYETRKRIPPIDVAAKLAKALDVHISILIGERAHNMGVMAVSALDGLAPENRTTLTSALAQTVDLIRVVGAMGEEKSYVELLSMIIDSYGKMILAALNMGDKQADPAYMYQKLIGHYKLCIRALGQSKEKLSDEAISRAKNPEEVASIIYGEGD